MNTLKTADARKRSEKEQFPTSPTLYSLDIWANFLNLLSYLKNVNDCFKFITHTQNSPLYVIHHSLIYFGPSGSRHTDKLTSNNRFYCIKQRMLSKAREVFSRPKLFVDRDFLATMNMKKNIHIDKCK